MKTKDLRQKFISFFQEKGHAALGSASLIPENDPTVLFTTAGVHPLVPFVLGEPHPGGKRLVSCQKCVRTGDIDEVGDASHLTFFEMLGNWSLGDYFKKEAIPWAWEFLTSKKWLNLNPERLSVTCFEGDSDAPRDEESVSIWKSAGVKDEKIFLFGKENNWWGPAGQTGPCGPDTEIFYETDVPKCGKDCSPACNCGHYMEIWNLVFMQYNKNSEGKYEPLKSKTVDTGMGLARTSAVLQSISSVYDTDAYKPLMDRIRDMTKIANERSVRIIADHVTAATFIIADGVKPSNLGAGYVLRRLLRRAIREGRKLEIEGSICAPLARTVIDNYKDFYKELDRYDEISGVMSEEEDVFTKTLAKGLKQFEKIRDSIDGKLFPGKQAFMLYSSFGFPPELTKDLCMESGFEFDQKGFEEELKKHAEASQPTKQSFKGGLADHTVETTKLHTATHLLNKALRTVLGHEVWQRGSNITPERLRFDFSFHRKMTPEEIAQVEKLVQDAIDRDLTVSFEEMSVDAAKESGAIGVFDNRYGDKVKVYTMGDFSKEICGGPHVEHTGVLGKFKIKKEEGISEGVRRIRAVLN